MIYTGYFARTKIYENAGLVPISISRWSPKWFNGEKCTSLAPSPDLLNRYKEGTASIQDYESEFLAMLNTIDVRNIVENLARGRDIVLCCYEKPTDFCHRHLIAKYLNDKYDMDIQEYPI